MVHAIFNAVGRFSVRWRWLVVAIWIVAAGAIIHAFPSLSSVVQNNNTSFLPSNTPTAIATRLNAVFSPAGVFPVPVVAVDPHGVGAADSAYLSRLTAQLRRVDNVVEVRDIGVSPDGKADQLQVLTGLPGGPGGQSEKFVGDLRSAVLRAAPPSGTQVHVTGDLAAQWTRRRPAATPAAGFRTSRSC